MGLWVMGQWVKWVTIFEWVTWCMLTRDPPLFYHPSKSQKNRQKFTVNTDGRLWTVIF